VVWHRQLRGRHFSPIYPCLLQGRLFLCAGSVMHAMAGSGDITRMGGPWAEDALDELGFSGCAGWPSAGSRLLRFLLQGRHHRRRLCQRGVWPASRLGRPDGGRGIAGGCAGHGLLHVALYYLVFTGECRADSHTREHLHESPIEMVGPFGRCWAWVLLWPGRGTAARHRKNRTAISSAIGWRLPVGPQPGSRAGSNGE